MRCTSSSARTVETKADPSMLGEGGVTQSGHTAPSRSLHLRFLNSAPRYLPKRKGNTHPQKDLHQDVYGTFTEITGDFPGGLVIKNLPSNAGQAGPIPGQGTKISHAAGQPSLRALEPARHN